MRTKRQAALIALIKKNLVHSQSQARTLLEKNGYPATQATISRDLEEIGVVKIRTKQGTQYTLTQEASCYGISQETAFKNYIVSAVAAANIIVIKTPPGHASVVAAAFDRTQEQGILGTVAGDDTLFVCTKSSQVAKQIARTLVPH